MKRILKKILIAILVLFVLVQIPFIYRRFETGQLSGRIAEVNANRVERVRDGYREYKGIIHVHTSLGGHSTGHFDELIDAASANELDFVLMTEHYSDKFDTSALTLNGMYGGTLFVGGHEVDTADGDRFLLIPGSPDAASFRQTPTVEFLERVHSEGKVALITYPHRFKSWESEFDGIEVFSLHTSAKGMNPLLALGDLVWTYGAYPDLMFARHFERPDGWLAKFDEVAARRPISLFAGTDGHSNIGFHLLGDDAGNKLINFKIDPYATIFRIARARVLLPVGQELTRESLTEAIRAGRYFTAVDSIGDSTGFVFEAATSDGRRQMGEDAAVGAELRAAAPAAGRFVFIQNGQRVHEAAGVSEASFTPTGPGPVRVEIYLDGLGEPFGRMPWIMSNPIYIR